MRRTSTFTHQLLSFLSAGATIFAHLSNAQECNFCENGITNPTLAFTEDGELTCADVPLLIQVGSTDEEGDLYCFNELENVCCPSQMIPDPCTFCENGVTNPLLMVPEGFVEQTTCAVAQIFASTYSRDDMMCANIRLEESSCCPPSTLSPTMKPITSQTTLPPTTDQMVSLSPTPPPVTPRPTETEIIDNPFNIPVSRSGIVSGVAFYDVNNNGYQEDLQEYGMWNVKASLYACGEDTTILAETSSSTQGTYKFKDLAEGSYYIKFEFPSYYTLGSVWNGDPSTLDSDNSVNPENGVTNCFTLGDGDKFKANVALTDWAVPPVTPPSTSVATPPPTLLVTTPPPTLLVTTPPPTLLVTTLPPTEMTAIAATPPPTVSPTLRPTLRPTVAATISNADMCAFCEDGIPDLMLMLPSGQTCDSVKETAADHAEGSNICNILQREETMCCPEFFTAITTLSPTDKPTRQPTPPPQTLAPTSYQPAPDFLSDFCTFCEDGIIDVGFEIPGRQGGTCASQKEMASAVDGLSPMCATIQGFENICCPSEPITNPCTFCQEGMPDQSIVVNGGQSCGSIQASASFFPSDSELCFTVQASESQCCPELLEMPPSPTLMPISASTNSPTVSTTQPTNITDATNSTNATVADFDLGLDFELVGPVTTNKVDMILVGIDGAEKFRVWQTDTANFIVDFFKNNPGSVYDVTVEVSMLFETITDISPGTYTGNPGVQGRRQLDGVKSVRITYDQVTTYRSEDPTIYDENYIIEEPFRIDPEGYIALLKSTSKTDFYDSLVEVGVTVPPPTPAPTPKPPVVFPVAKKNTFDDNMTYIIIGAACGGVLIFAVACILIVRRRRKHRGNTGNTHRGTIITIESGDDEDWQSRDMNDVASSNMLDREEVMPSGEVMVHVIAPKGKLGIVVDTLPWGSPPYVKKVKKRGPLFGRVQQGDKIIAVDDDDVQQLSAKDVQKLLESKKKNPQRKLTIVREGSQRGDRYTQTNQFVSSAVAVNSVSAMNMDYNPSSHEGNNPLNDESASQNQLDYGHAFHDHALKRNEQLHNIQDSTAVTVIAPMGKLGIVVEDSSDGGPPFVGEIQKGSALEGELQLFDRIASIDDQDVKELKAFHISKLLAHKSQNLERKIVVLREKSEESQNRFIV